MTKEQNNLSSKTRRPLFDWALCLGLVLLFAAGFIALFGMRYEVNDDAIISNIAAGAYGQSTQYLVYVNLLFGFLLKPFFALIPGVNWFVALLFLAGICCFGYLGVLLLRYAGRLAGVFLFCALLFCAGSEFFVYFHYGRYAGLFLTCGLLLVVQHLGRWNLAMFAGLFLALLGSLLRFQMFLAIGGLCAALLLWRFLRLEKKQRLRAALSVLLLFVLVLGCKGIDTAVYQADEGWASYRRFNAVRTEISDFRLQFAEDRNAYEQQGYSANDLEMMEHWAYYDGEVFSADKLELFASALPANTFTGTAKTFVLTVAEMLYSTPLHLLFGVFLAAWLLLYKRRNWPVVCGTLGVLLLEVLYLSWQGRLPQRIDFALVFATLLFCAAAVAMKEAPCVSEDSKKVASSGSSSWWPFRANLAAFTLAVLVLANAPFLWQQRTQMQDYWASRLPRAAEIDALAADKQNLYLLDSYLVDAANGFEVWHTRPAGYFSNTVFVGSWLMESPFQNDVLEAYDMESPYRDAIDREDVLLADYYYRELKEDYMREHYGANVQIVLVEERGDFNLYRFVST